MVRERHAVNNLRLLARGGAKVFVLGLVAVVVSSAVFGFGFNLGSKLANRVL